jgi:hypothetical protein
MHQLPIEQQVLEALQIATLLALCLKMWWQGLYRTYAFFFGYLVLEFSQELIPVLVPVDSSLYRNSYVASQALILCSYALVVLELYAVILRNLEGIAGVARRYIKITLALAIVLSLLPLLLEKVPDTLTGYLFSFERPILSSLLFFVLLITVFLVYYPVPIGRNIIVYLIGYAALFIADGTFIFVNNLGYYQNRALSNVDMGVSLSCFLFWLMALDRRGERKNVVVSHFLSGRDEQRLLAQLEAINATLLRSSVRKQLQ